MVQAEKDLGTEITYTAMDPNEFRFRLDMSDRFLRSVMEAPKTIRINKLGSTSDMAWLFIDTATAGELRAGRLWSAVQSSAPQGRAGALVPFLCPSLANRCRMASASSQDRDHFPLFVQACWRRTSWPVGGRFRS